MKKIIVWPVQTVDLAMLVDNVKGHCFQLTALYLCILLFIWSFFMVSYLFLMKFKKRLAIIIVQTECLNRPFVAEFFFHSPLFQIFATDVRQAIVVIHLHQGITVEGLMVVVVVKVRIFSNDADLF